MKALSTGRIKRSALQMLALAAAIAAPSIARADTLFYNGNYDFNDADTNQSKVPINFGGSYLLDTTLVYDDFVVPVGQSWSIASLYANDQMSYYSAPTNATWQIRSGMSDGNGGTLLFSGDTTATATQTNAEDDVNYFDPEFKISAAVTGVTLSAGTYWFAVAPDSAGYYGDQSYIETTSGVGSVGLPTGIDGDSFINNNLPSDGQLTFAASSLDFSAGITGTATAVPEPSTGPLLAAGVVGGFFFVRRRRGNVGQSVAVFGGGCAPTSSFRMMETLEARQLMSATVVDPTVPTAHMLHVEAVHLRQLEAMEAAHAAHPNSGKHKFNDIVTFHVAKAPNQAKVAKQATYSPVVGAYTPTQVRTAYGVSALPITNEGQGMTIGIVDEFNDEKIINDANVFSTQYKLPQFNTAGGPTMSVVLDPSNGATTVPTAVGEDVADETSLDVEWAHAIAPQANILLVEVPATGSNANAFAQLLSGVQVAAQDGAQSISLSYGLSESQIGASSVVSLNNTYLAAGTAAAGTVVAVSSGDGSTPLYPATSPNVVAVGGTSLYLASARGTYSFETAWGGLAGAGAGGGGQSTNFAAPTFQSSHGVSYAKRAIPDVALIADPVTGVSYYDSEDVTTSNPDPWGAVGGTSLAAPVFAGMASLAQQTRVAAGKSLLTSAQVDNAIYSVYNSGSYSTYFRDIKQGSNANKNSSGTTTVTGFAATTGYDEATGVGSPIANTFMPYLASL